MGLAAWLLFLLAVSELIRNRRALAQAGRQRLIEEQRSRYEAAQRQASEERLGIARDLHDVVAHSLSLINVQAGVALELMEQKPEQVRTALTAIKHTSRDALVDVQSALDSLRRPGEEAPRAPAPGLRDVEELVRRAEATGLVVDVHVTEAPSALPRGVDAAGYRIVQEALTNVVRHADASRVSVRIGEEDGALVIEVEDDGAGRPGDPGLAGVRVVILTTFELDEYVFAALRAGASGFLVKHTEPAELVRAVRVVATGEALLSPSVTRRLISEFADRAKPPPPAASMDALTERERQLVGLVGEGLSNEDIARRLVLSPATVKTHVNRAMMKLGARDRAHLVVFAYEAGLVRPGWAC